MDEAIKAFFSSNSAKKGDLLETSEWIHRQIHLMANCGKFSSDRSIAEYCDEVWNVQDLSIPKGVAGPDQQERIRSFPNLSQADKIREKMNTTQAPTEFIKSDIIE